MMKEAFILYQEHEAIFEKLTDEQAGQLIKIIFEYEKTGQVKDCDPFIDLAFTMIKSALDRNRTKYENKVEANRSNGILGGRPKTKKNPNNPSGFEETQQNPTNLDRDSDSVYDNEPDKDLERERGKDKEREENNLLSQPINLNYSYERFKEIYPRNKNNVQPGMSRALRLWSDSTNGHAAEVFKALENYCRSEDVKNGFIMGADKFITDSWRDYLEFKRFGKDEQDGPIELL